MYETESVGYVCESFKVTHRYDNADNKGTKLTRDMGDLNEKKLLLEGIPTMTDNASERHLGCPHMNSNCRDVLLCIPEDQVRCPLPNTNPFRQFFNCDMVSCELVQASEALLVKFRHKTGKVFTSTLRVIITLGKPFRNQGIVEGLNWWTRSRCHWWNCVLLGVERRELWVIHGGLSIPERWVTGVRRHMWVWEIWI
jgi:hypothetical protein